MSLLRLFAFSVLICLVVVKAEDSQEENGPTQPPPLVQERKKLPTPDGPQEKSQPMTVEQSLHNLLASLQAAYKRSLNSLKEGQGVAKNFFEEIMLIAKERDALQTQLQNYKAALSSQMSLESRNNLKKMMREDVEQYKDLVVRSFSAFLTAAGIPRSEFEKTLKTEPRFRSLLSFLRRLSVSEFIPYL